MLPKAKKSFGQNFLTDKTVVKKILAAAEIVPGERVLEIGPGTGVLTEALVDAGASVVAVESDKDLIPALEEKFGDRIELIEGDILKLHHSVTPSLPSYKLVANIPYNITSDVIQTFLTAAHKPSRMVLMVQREVADRIVAKPPRMSLLSVVCQLYADVKKVTNVPAGAFRPVPKVGSAVIQMDQKSETGDNERVIRLAKAGFSSKRKQLHNNLVSQGFSTSDEGKEQLKKLGLDPLARAETLTVENWVNLAKVFHY